MDTMEITKIVGSICGALLALLLVVWGAETLYHVGGGHGGDDQAAYVIEVEEDSAGAEEEEAVPFAELLAAADVAKGEKVFGKCKSCHKLEDGGKGTGPHLYNIVDRAIGGIDGFGYSSVLAEMGGNWGVDELNGFLENPKGFAPKTKMSFKGLKKPQDRANIIAYLQTIGG